jgi:hypothetical protein
MVVEKVGEAQEDKCSAGEAKRGCSHHPLEVWRPEK